MKFIVDELPNSCQECLCRVYDHHICYTNEDIFKCKIINKCVYDTENKRHTDCPLSVSKQI